MNISLSLFRNVKRGCISFYLSYHHPSPRKKIITHQQTVTINVYVHVRDYVSQIISNRKNEVRACIYLMILILQVALNRKKILSTV